MPSAAPSQAFKDFTDLLLSRELPSRGADSNRLLRVLRSLPLAVLSQLDKDSITHIFENMNVRINKNFATKIDTKSMRAAADESSALLKALSNRHRLLLLCRLVDGEKSVGQLADFLGVRNSTASQHLALLRRDRIIAGRRDGQTIWYRIASEPALAVMQALYESYCAGSKPQSGRAPK